jgi:hypothetical protein
MGRQLSELLEVGKELVREIRSSILFTPTDPEHYYPRSQTSVLKPTVSVPTQGDAVDLYEGSADQRVLAHVHVVGCVRMYDEVPGVFTQLGEIYIHSSHHEERQVKLIYKVATANCMEYARLVRHEIKTKHKEYYVYVVSLHTKKHDHPHSSHVFNILSLDPIHNLKDGLWKHNAIICDAWTKDESRQVYLATELESKATTWQYNEYYQAGEVLGFSKSVGELNLLSAGNIDEQIKLYAPRMRKALVKTMEYIFERDQTLSDPILKKIFTAFEKTLGQYDKSIKRLMAQHIDPDTKAEGFNSINEKAMYSIYKSLNAASTKLKAKSYSVYVGSKAALSARYCDTIVGIHREMGTYLLASSGRSTEIRAIRDMCIKYDEEEKRIEKSEIKAHSTFSKH